VAHFISLMPQNLQDVKKAVVVSWRITNIRPKCSRYPRAAAKDTFVFFKDVGLMVKLLPGTDSSLNVT